MKKTFILVFSIVSPWACSTHDTVPAPTSPASTGEMPCSSLIASNQISIYKYNSGYNGAALGCEFKIKADGHVSGLGCASAAIGNYTLTLFKVDTVNKVGTQIAEMAIAISSSDTVNFKFKYVYLSSKVAVSKGNYYRVSINGDFSSYDYLAFPTGSSQSLPFPLSTDNKIVFTKGVTGYANQYPDTEYTNYMFPADVVIQFP